MTERLLSISGEDSLSIDRKNTTAVESKLDTRLMLLSNELPRLSDVSGALAGRMIILRLSRKLVRQGGPWAVRAAGAGTARDLALGDRGLASATGKRALCSARVVAGGAAGAE